MSAAMTDATNHIQVLLNLAGRSEHFCKREKAHAQFLYMLIKIDEL
jgi:hypothetical protein